ncbi:hypothetical protein [Oxynema aestuarii]|jgi:hypothetical protein|uniref:Uncharacterized protein n=1 Tax=Oxynema aestuarii AP17 TaxID=2064643 RepID=A0A6H1TYN5_9CYAN|nr:hypothetical protein [Oxynema aestuarii]QIZ71712.1 hypothetical protein HCG48_14910 [Oxynema aestuarii AP17]RMH76159.1 MAG: hypothetical protein D6680_09370 [Cyanobacteria bacterium J007]
MFRSSFGRDPSIILGDRIPLVAGKGGGGDGRSRFEYRCFWREAVHFDEENWKIMLVFRAGDRQLKPGKN